MTDTQETIADIIAEMRMRSGEASEWADRIKAAHNRRVDILIYALKTYKDAVKPLLDYNFGDYQPPWKKLWINGEPIDGAAKTADGYAFSLVDSGIFGVDAMIEMANLIWALQKSLNPLKEEDGAKEWHHITPRMLKLIRERLARRVK